MTSKQKPDLLTITEAARLTRQSRENLSRRVTAGAVPCVKIGTNRFITREWAMDPANRNQGPGRPRTKQPDTETENET